MKNARRGGAGRTDRINEEIRKEMSQIFYDLKDPRIDVRTSVLRTETTRDLKYCKIYVTTLGDAAAQAEVKEALKSASGFIRRELAHRLNLRVTPELTFLMDDSIEYSIHMAEMIKSIDLGPETEEEDEA
ncbi:MAG: 30S ribosome-binding factor RbfA [Clostridiales bacterium]|nr:30S ribosome-binding factor RbfA [Clostridiales bacterium]